MVPQSTDTVVAKFRSLLHRCRAALAPGEAGWEEDLEDAMEKDAALVIDIDRALA